MTFIPNRVKSTEKSVCAEFIGKWCREFKKGHVAVYDEL